MTDGNFFSGFRSADIRSSKYSGVAVLKTDATARHSPSMAQVGLNRTSCPIIAGFDRILR